MGVRSPVPCEPEPRGMCVRRKSFRVAQMPGRLR